MDTKTAFYARPANENGERETAERHLTEVSRLAGENASHFGKEYEGSLAGKYHDFGKISNRFQEVLSGAQTKVNHEWAGAVLLSKRYGNKATQELQLAVCAHHKGLDFTCLEGLKNYFILNMLDPFGRKMSFETLQEFVSAYRYFSQRVAQENTPLEKPAYTVCKNPAIERMLYIRMLFSSLVDADYTVSAGCFDNEYELKSSGEPLDYGLWMDGLLEASNKIKYSSAANTRLNELRDRVFEDCLNAAEKDAGLFTLTAPTGMGKTLSLMAFALKHAQKHRKRRIIIVLPFLSIIEQNASQYRTIRRTLLEDHSQTEYTEETRLYAERWNADVIVTTSVRFFELMFQHMPTDCRRLHSISNSVIVFDEAQSLPHSLIGATLESVNALCKRFNCSVLFSTATQPAFEFRPDLNWQPTEIINKPEELFEATRRVRISWNVDEKMSFLQIARSMADCTSCCTIVNLKRHATELFKELRQACADNESLLHISTDMCAAHRKQAIQTIETRLRHGLPCRVVSTQCIEAGVDLDFDRVFRALAPLDSIVQSAGRCNRNGRLDAGEVIVFVPEDDSYPDAAYENAANIVRLLLKTIDIDINNQEHIRLYYQHLYRQFSQDKPELVQAIENLDFAAVSDAYKLIQKNGFNLIVPYTGALALYDSVCRRVHAAKGLTPQLMRDARPITVTVYDSRIASLAEQLSFQKRGGGHAQLKTNWFILHQRNLYDDATGLSFDKDTCLETVV